MRVLLGHVGVAENRGRWQGRSGTAKSGEIYPEWLTINAVRDHNGALINFVAVFSDNSGIKQSQTQLATRPSRPAHDLPNRLLFDDRLRMR